MASKKIVITVERIDEGAYHITAEDDVAVGKYTTTQPRAVINDIFKEFKIIGKRGRPVGSRKAVPIPRKDEEVSVA